QQRQQDAFEAEIATAAIEPFLQGVRSSTHAAASYGNGFAAQGQGDIRVSRSTLNLGSIAQLRIYGANHFQDSRVGIEVASRTIPNRHDFAANAGGRSGSRSPQRCGAPLAVFRLSFDRAIERDA